MPPGRFMSSSRRAKSRRIKRIAGNILVVILGIIALFLLVGLFLPRTYRVERSEVIHAKPEAIQEYLVALRRWPEWTAWNTANDPTLQFEFESPDQGVGAAYRWNGKATGQGRLKIAQAEPGQGIVYELEFEGGKYTAGGSIKLVPENTDTRVVWLVEGDLGKNPIGRYFGLTLKSQVGAQFQRGLETLRGKVEAGTTAK